MKAATHAGFSGAHLEFIADSEAACRAIPPLWPLAATVAVNPYLGQTHQNLADVAGLMARVGGGPVTMPNAWYDARITDGTITDADLLAALAGAPAGAPASLEALKAMAKAPDAAVEPLPTLADYASEVSGIDWTQIIEDRIGAWAAGYFDTGQALWQATPGRGAFESWQIFASRDLTPEIAGLSGFAATVAALPARARTALALACDAIGITHAAAPTYFHQLLLGLGGWSQLGRQHLWQAELIGQSDTTASDMLTIRLVWEQVLWAQYGAQFAERWAKTCAVHAMPPAPTPDQVAQTVLQEAAERAGQRALSQTLSGSGVATTKDRPTLQAAFCIDVRSEVFRRALESLDPGYQTLGFAGFFGVTAAHRDFGSDVVEARLPVLLNPGFQTTATAPGDAAADLSARLAARASRAWGRFKLAAVSSFAFVEATGPVYAGKLVRDALGVPHKASPKPPKPQFSDDFARSDRIAAARTILRAMSLSEGFAPLVLLVGHGADVVNNPHASALQCGACGGYAGDVNARLLAGLLNEPKVRAGLAEEGIEIPSDTYFVGALHNTTTDVVTLFDTEGLERGRLGKVEAAFAAAGQIARTERAQRLPRAENAAAIAARSTDWSEVRPEWALAGCNAFIAAPRSRTRGKALAGRAFLHDYNWTKDDGFGVLELILTAPVVVASWISLQYYGSVVSPETFGGGNKLLHNVTGGVGVVEGNGGILRGGLPWQSVHDGNDYAHDPLRLTVCVEAPAGAVLDILAKHPQVRALFDNRWLHLVLLDQHGQMAQRYIGDLAFEDIAGPVAAAA